MTVAAHGGDIYQNQITYDFSVNTNPLPLPEILQKRMAEAAVHSNRYPQYDNVLLRERLAVLYGFSTEEVVCGNGASELFVAIVHALRPKRVGILAPSFSGRRNPDIALDQHRSDTAERIHHLRAFLQIRRCQFHHKCRL